MKSNLNIIGVGILCTLFAIFLTACGSGGGSDSNGGEDSSDSSIDAQAAPYVGYWTGSTTNGSGESTTIQVSIWENGVVDRRTVSNFCNGGISGSRGEWNSNSYTYSESNGSSTMTIDFSSLSLAIMNVKSQMDCYTMIGDISKQSSSPQALF